MVLYRSPECWGYAELEQTWKYKRPKFWCQQEGLITMVVCCKFKKKRISSTSDFIHIFSQNVHSRRSEADNPRGQIFDVNRTLLSLRSFATSLEQYPNLKSDSVHFFHDFIQPLGNEILMSTGTSCHFGHLLQVSKTSLWSLILYKNFHGFYMYIAPMQGQTAPRGQNFYINRNFFSLHSFVASLKKDLIKVWFYTFFFFHDLIYVYCPGAGVGADSPQVTKFWCQKKGLITLPICCRFQKNLFEVWFDTIYFHDLIHVYSPGQGADSP